MLGIPEHECALDLYADRGAAPAGRLLDAQSYVIGEALKTAGLGSSGIGYRTQCLRASVRVIRGDGAGHPGGWQW
jgi:hypothetical protein